MGSGGSGRKWEVDKLGCEVSGEWREWKVKRVRRGESGR